MNTNDFPNFLSPENKDSINYFRNLFGDKLQLYQYCESQLSRIAFANSIFIAAIAMIVSSGMQLDVCKVLLYTLYVCTVLIFVPFVVSLRITLCCAIPKFFRRRLSYGKADHSSIYGIIKFKNVEDYKNYISKLTANDIYNEIITQIYNMNDTIIRDYKEIEKAVKWDRIGLISFMVYLIFKFVVISIPYCPC